MIDVVFQILSVTVSVLFFIYGYNCYFMLSSLKRYRSPSPSSQAHQKQKVAIHLPVYNEKYVVKRLIQACARIALEYGQDYVRIVVLDDSDDDTGLEIEKIVEEVRGKGIRTDIVRRVDRQGFKAGALQAALENSDEEFIAIFDADFIPPDNFLSVTIPFFLEDKSLGIVQSRWEHINSDYNFFTKAIAIGIDVHFFVEQTGRVAAGCFLNFNGSGGIIRKEALLKSGGWQTDTLAEDLDASYRIQLNGYRILFLRDLSSPGEIPPNLPSFKKQQARWANGSLRTAKKLLTRLLADKSIGVGKRLQGVIHLTYYLVHPLMFFSFLIAVISSVFGIGIMKLRFSDGIFNFIIQNMQWIILSLAITMCTIAVWLYPVAALRARNKKVRNNIQSILILGLIGFGINLSNTIEAGRALFTRKIWNFRRTPKYAIHESSDDWKSKKYQVPLDVTVILEAGMAGLGITAITAAFLRSNFMSIPILTLYTASYGFVFFMTFLQSGNWKRG